MRQVREVLRLKWACGLSDRKIAQSLRVSRPTVAEYVRRAQAAGLSWPLPDTLDDTALERRLFATAAPTPIARRPTPDWTIVHQELKRKGVTLLLLWQEYKANTPDGLQYSQFCEAYRQWAGKLDLVMRQSHRAGETLFVDYAGQTMPVVNALTGEVRASRDLHRRPGRFQLYLCRSDLEPESARLDRVACPHLHGAWWGAPGRGPG